VLENWKLTVFLEAKGKKVTGGWIKIHDEALHIRPVRQIRSF
jgi:hypothetical protein